MGAIARLFGREERSVDTMDPLLVAILRQDTITRVDAMNIPAFAGCVKYISEAVASLPVKLYREVDGKVDEVKEDPRAALLNEDTGDMLTGYQLKQALAADIVIEGAGYAYIRRDGNAVVGLHYVERPAISFLPGIDPIFKRCGIMVGGKEYRDFEFIKATRTTKDGVRGAGVLAESQLALAVPYNTLKYENTLVRTGGNKKGFLKSEGKLDQDAQKLLKAAWKKLYGSADENVVILNKGLDFKEASSTSVELQMNENKITNAVEVCKLFTVPPSILDGTATEEEKDGAFQRAVNPVLESIAAALNRDLLLETEKAEYFFAFDTKELLRGSIDSRFAAYKAGIESNVLQIDEARYMENLPPLGLTFIKLGLQDVLYNVEDKTVFVPNTGVVSPVGAGKETAPLVADPVKPEPAELPKSTAVERPPDETETKSVTLNGAQISGVLEITNAVATGMMERGAALVLLEAAFPFDRATASKILGGSKAAVLPAEPNVKGGEEGEH